jgi:prepilin-type N-terminal cleavage/methylation domain-containing protein
MLRNTRAFTIVELLIVIVVIGIIAAITVVAYAGVQDKARTNALTSSLAQVSKKMRVWNVDNPGVYPSSLADIGITNTESITYTYDYDNAASPATYCLKARSKGVEYNISNVNDTPTAGGCGTYNLIAWTKPQSGTSPVPSAAIDTSVFRTSTASVRIGPNSTGVGVRGAPYGGVGQTYTLSGWILTDAGWNGLNNNSKIRFGNASGGGLLSACGYGGVKTTWTQISCSWTVTEAAPSVTITVGNDGTTGNIWLDDMVLTRS